MAPQLNSGNAEAMIDPTNYDYIIVGAGPAGLQMAYFLQKSGRRYVVYEAAAKAATFFASHPRHGRLISLNKKHNLFEEDEFNMRHDWNSLLSDDKEMRFTEYSDDLYPQANDLHRYLNDFAQKFQLNIEYNTRVMKVSKPEDVFTVVTEKDDSQQTCTARCVLMATGAIEENLPENIEGIELAETYSKHDLNKEVYKNKMILVIGGGNSAFETADHLSGSAAIVHVAFNKRIQFAWDTHFVGDLRAVNNNIIDMYHLKSLHSTIASNVIKIVKNDQGKFVATFRDLNTHWDVPGWLHFEMEYDQIISCMGWKYIKPEMFDETIQIDLVKTGRYPDLSECWETGTENLFYIGAAMGAIDRQSASGFIHGFRYNIRTLHHLLENRFFHKSLPHQVLPHQDLGAIAKKVIERSTISDSLYQMNGFLCDVITFDDQGCTRYYTDLPIKYVMKRTEFKEAKDVFIVHLSYGFDKFGETAKPVDNVHAPDFSNNRCASFLHPYIEYYSRGEYVDQTELHESLIVRYDDWSNSKFPQWTSSANENYVKYFINDKMMWTDEVFNLLPLPPHVINQIFVPLNEEEKSRLRPLWEKSECKPSQDLLPKKSMPQQQRHLRPSQKEVFASVGSTLSTSSPSSPTLSPQTKRIGSQLDMEPHSTTRQ